MKTMRDKNGKVVPGPGMCELCGNRVIIRFRMECDEGRIAWACATCKKTLENESNNVKTKDKPTEEKQMNLRTSADLLSTLFDEVEYAATERLPPDKPTKQQRDALARVWSEVVNQEQRKMDYNEMKEEMERQKKEFDQRWADYYKEKREIDKMSEE